ncbi:MAG: ABC transporter ATP-binding protein [Actinomycetota bacterium]
MAGLTFTRVRKNYGGVRALRGFDLEIKDGELMVLVGPSASGKTTALRVAAGLEEVTNGHIHIGARDVTGLPPAERNVAMVFQSYALFPHLTVADNIGFGLEARRVPKRDVRRRVRLSASIVGCARLLERKPFQLSGGERQRVALARALVREPDVFLLDEPLSNLDAQLRVSMRAELEQLHQRLAATMLYVTHDQVEALTMGDRIAVLNKGAIQQVGTPNQIYRRPANRFVAGFIGSPAMNFLPAIMRGERLRVGPFVLKAPRRRTGLRGRMEAGIRPEHVAVRTSGAGVPAVVQVVEVAGNETFLHVDADGHRLIARFDGGRRVTLGSTVRLRAGLAHTYLFDPRSGMTLRHPR